MVQLSKCGTWLKTWGLIHFLRVCFSNRKYELIVVIPKLDEDGRLMDLGDPDVEFPPANVKPYPLPDDESLTLPYAYKCKVWLGNDLEEKFVIGSEDLPSDLAREEVYNGPLRKGTYYSFFLRAFTVASPGQSVSSSVDYKRSHLEFLFTVAIHFV